MKVNRQDLIESILENCETVCIKEWGCELKESYCLNEECEQCQREVLEEIIK